MKVYEFIQQLVEFPPDADIYFDIGNFTGSDCTLRQEDYIYMAE